MKYIVQHPIINVVKFIGFVLSWYWFGWNLALIVFLLSLEFTVER